ncbi:MAG: hypothetical protein JNL94_16395 [Planctomycetes bacterium]|nr:hypothetical protein [Planctomycetota bacterium]
MTTESDSMNSGFLATIVFGGAFLTLTAIFAMQGLSLQSDEWQFEKKFVDVAYPELVATQTEARTNLNKLERVDANTVAVPIDVAKDLVVKQLRGK